jgi:hypothetical protein
MITPASNCRAIFSLAGGLLREQASMTAQALDSAIFTMAGDSDCFLCLLYLSFLIIHLPQVDTK